MNQQMWDDPKVGFVSGLIADHIIASLTGEFYGFEEARADNARGWTFDMHGMLRHRAGYEGTILADDELRVAWVLADHAVRERLNTELELRAP